jgi:signal transduction histidine kinase/DNA-binding response OmpR family regulator
MSLKHLILSYIGTFLISTIISFGQSDGKLLITNYNQLQIGSESGVFWSVIKDQRGIMYFGGEGEVFEFDGINWRGIKVSNFSVVRSLAVDERGVVYVGAVGEFGYLEPDRNGQMQYVSLLPLVPKNKLSFPDVWSIGVKGDEIYFLADNRLFRYKNDKIDTWELQNSYHRSFIIEGKIYLNQGGIGLCTLQDNKIQLVPNGDFFHNKIISSITTYENGKVLIGSRNDGTFIYTVYGPESGKIVEFKSQANEFLKANHLYYGINLPEGRMAFATLRGGVIICDRDGNIIRYINKLTGFNDYTAYYLNLFNDNELWITSSKGIGFYLINSPLSYWTDEQGIIGFINNVIEYNNRIYVATNSGLFYQELNNTNSNKSEYSPGTFQLFNDLKTEVWDIRKFDPTGKFTDQTSVQLIAATGRGLYNINQRSVVFPTEGNGQITICQSGRNPSILYFNTHQAFYILQYSAGKWHVLWKKKISSYILTVVEDVDGDVWIGTKFYGIFRINLKNFFNNNGSECKTVIPDGAIGDLKVDHFTTLSGLQNLNLCLTHIYKNNLIISCNGLYSYDNKTNHFVKATIFGEDVKDWNKTVNAFKEDIYGNIWGLESGVLDKQPDGSFKLTYLPFQMFSVKNSTLTFYHDKNGITWIGGEQGLFRYDSRAIQPTENSSFYTLIRKVTIDKDSVIFDGVNYKLENNRPYVSLQQPEELVPTLSYKNKTISFEYACPYFQDDIPLQYSYYLEGYENNWSDWSNTIRKEYNNLREKTYKFHVRAKKYSGTLSTEGIYKFTITPPWYRTILAYLLYVLILALSLYYSIKIYSLRLRRYNLILERQVKERTVKLEEQKEEINNQALILKQQNEKLIHQKNRMTEMSKEILETNKSKLHFFTNISHELRTPLTLILGPTEELLKSDQSLSEKVKKDFYTVIHRNASRLLTLVNQILDFRKLEITNQRIKASKGELVYIVGEIVSCFKDLAVQKKIEFAFSSENSSLQTWFDKDVIEKILFNLISNAFKYTYEKGKISVNIKLADKHPLEEITGKAVMISVKDNGIGINQEVLPKIFDRYYHSSRSVSLSQAGSGMGLSMAAKLAETHHGKITVSSELNKGSNFILFIPYGDEYLDEDEKDKSTDILSNSDYIESNLGEYKYLNTVDRNIETQVVFDNNKEIVLIVDDSYDIRFFIKNSLLGQFNFLEAEDGIEGLKMARKHAPDLIICDIMMPNMDGYEFCKMIKSEIETSHIPVILLTSKSSISDQKLGLDIGADDFISKPFNIRLLESRINNILKSRNELRNRFRKEIVIKPTDIVINSTDEKFLNKAIKTVEEHISDPTYDIDAFSREMAMSQSTLYRKLKLLVGESTNNFIKDMRLNRAASLLAQNEISVSEIANMVGFDDPAYFSKSFKQKFGISPSEYSKNHL